MTRRNSSTCGKHPTTSRAFLRKGCCTDYRDDKSYSGKSLPLQGFCAKVKFFENTGSPGSLKDISETPPSLYSLWNLYQTKTALSLVAQTNENAVKCCIHKHQPSLFLFCEHFLSLTETLQGRLLELLSTT